MAISRLAAKIAGFCLFAGPGFSNTSRALDNDGSRSATPIEHLVVIFQENVSFNHYFATHSLALNPPGEPVFRARNETPSVGGLGTLVKGAPDGILLTDNPNRNNPANGTNAINPVRLDRWQAATCDQDHNYGHEQQAFDQGLMDLFPLSVGVGLQGPPQPGKGQGLGNGVFRRQHRHGAMELRAAFRDERQFLRHDLRALDTRIA
jgi:phospholipase C